MQIYCFQPKSSAAISLIISAIANDPVAAGEGALRRLMANPSIQLRSMI